MENSEELLYYAAKAAKITYPQTNMGSRQWNPLDNDGDAFRLALAISMKVDFLIYETEGLARLDIVRRAAYVGQHTE